MLKRKIYDDLLEWKKNRSKTKALLIMGARQVGKSTIARYFGKHNYKQVIEINFLTDSVNKKIFRTGDPQTILNALSTVTKKTIIKGETLVILDEIQECPNARTAIKFLVEDGTCDYIETGSLLGIQNKQPVSFPVGYEQQINMYPMDFEEYLWALEYPQNSLEYLKKCYENKTPVGEAVHETFLNVFYSYIVIGGMPEVVNTYVETKNIGEAFERQKDILALYRNDITKFTKGLMSLKMRQIFDSIPSQLDDKKRRFYLNSIGKGTQFRQLENSFLWLDEAGVALPCYNTTAPISPLQLNEKRNLFKLYMNDTGLLCAASLGDVRGPLLLGEVDINSGSILENVFAQSLKSKNFNLYYYDAKRIELDFLVQNGAAIDVLEIKSGKSYKSHSSLDKAMTIKDWKFNEKIVFCRSDLFEEDGILYLPFYMIMFYGQKEEQKLFWEPPKPNFLNNL